MKKLNHIGKDDNVIQFPDLGRRLLEKGQECLQRESYQEAITLFEHAVKLDSANSDSYLGLVLAYYGAGYDEEAGELAKVMLHEGIGNYFDIMDLYIKLLFQTHQYSEIVTAIEVLLEERTIPSERLEHFYSMLDISRQLMDGQEGAEIEDRSFDEVMEGELRLLDYGDPQEQLMLTARLAKQNIQPYLSEILTYLQSNERTPEGSGDPFFKTLLINVLKEHQYDKPIEVHKFGKVMQVIPKKLQDVYENPELQRIIHLIGSRIEHDDPILYESIKMLIHRQFFLLYPFPLDSKDMPAWAAAYHALGLEYFGNPHKRRELLEEYHVLEDDLDRADSFIRRIEEISYPNI